MAIDIDFGALRTVNPFEAYAQGQQLGTQMRQQQTRQAAGNIFATDPDQAAQILASSGDLQGAASLQQYGQARKTAAMRSRAAQQYSSGDVAGAQATALGAGDTDLLSAIHSLDDQKRTALAEQQTRLANIGFSLKRLPYEQRKAQLATLAPHAAELGLTPDQVQGFDPTDAEINRVVVQALGIAKMTELGKPMEMDPTKNYYVSDLAGSSPSAAAPPPAAGPAAAAQATSAPDPDAVWQAMVQRESGGDGNAEGPQTAYGRAQGSTQMLMSTAEGMARKLGVPWRPDLMRGDTPAALSYQQKLGRAYFDEGLQKYGGDVHQAAMYYHGGPDQSIWGPKTHAYADAVAGGAQPYQVAANGPTPAPPANLPGYHLVAQGQQQWQPDGKGVLVNAATGDRKKDPAFDSAGAGAGAADPNIVKGLIEGRIMPPTQKAAATPYWQAQLQAAAQQDPTFDMVNYQARAKARADFTSGKSAQNITALNTVIGHLDHLDQTIGDLGNAGPGGAINFGPLTSLNNKAAHFFAGVSGTDARFKNFETAKTAVANELTRVFRGTGGAEADIQKWMQQLDGAGSPQALHEVVRSMAELINSRIEALGEQYTQGMGTTKDPITLLTPDKQKAFQRMLGRGDASGAPPASGQTPTPGAILYDVKGNRIG